MRNILLYCWRRLMLWFVNILAIPPHLFILQEPRYLLLRMIGVVVGRRVEVSEELYVLNGRNLVIGNGVRLGSFCRIWDFHKVALGDNLLASHNLTIVAGTHDPETLAGVPAPVTIGRDCWIGVNVTIVGPVVIGDRVIIGAGSTVLKDLPSGTVCAGVPAKVLRNR